MQKDFLKYMFRVCFVIWHTFPWILDMWTLICETYIIEWKQLCFLSDNLNKGATQPSRWDAASPFTPKGKHLGSQSHFLFRLPAKSHPGTQQIMARIWIPATCVGNPVRTPGSWHLAWQSGTQLENKWEDGRSLSFLLPLWLCLSKKGGRQEERKVEEKKKKRK